MSDKFSVWVCSVGGVWVAHGPARASEVQARSVARQLARRLGWVTVWAVACPAPVGALAGGPSVALAGLSPVWKDPGLAARWAAAGKS